MPLSPEVATRGSGNMTITMILGGCLTQREHFPIPYKDLLS